VRLPASRTILPGVIAALVAAIQAIRLVTGDSADAGVSMLLLLPVAIIGIDRGVRAGILAGVGAYAIWLSTSQVDDAVAGEIARGSVFLLVGLVTGSSARRLRDAAARQRHFADALGDMVSAHDPDGKYLYASGASKALLGYDPAELVGTWAYEYFHPHDASTVRDAHEAVLFDPAAQTTVYRVRRADGRYVWFETVSRAVRRQGPVVEILCSSRDVTRREVERVAQESGRDELRRQVQQVLDDRGIEPVFQPIMHLGTSQTVGFEALARFPLVIERPPNVWFEQAWEVGLGTDLELLAVERALEMFDQLPADAWLSVNASAETACSTRLLDVVRAVPANRLIVELTEHSQIVDYSTFNAHVAELRALGIRLAIDDAGAGFASLRHILDIHPDVIKLDMSLTRHIHRDPARHALAGALCGFAGSLEAIVIAEGIEEPEELDELIVLGITHGQGYLLGRPGHLGPSQVGLDEGLGHRAPS
jgi:PAS domain S-box-containing protein